MAAQELRTAAVAAKYQLLQPSRHVQLSCRLLNSSVVKLLSASSEARPTAVEEEWSRFSLLSLSLSLFLSSELSCSRGWRPPLHILVLSRNPFSR